VTVTGSPPATSVKVGDLDPGTSYTFKVQAANGSGSGPLSAASNAVTPSAPTAPGAPTGLLAGAGNQQVTVRWSAPNDGGRTITRYTVTPYLNGVPQATTAVTGSPAPTSAVVTGLTNGSSYTFTVSATNAAGTGPESAASNAVTPNAAPRFVQRVSGRNTSGASLQLTPTATIASGDRFVVMAGVWSSGGATISGVTDSAGNTYTKVTNVNASDNTELSVWTAPITAGDGSRPSITVTATGNADIGGAALEYAGLSTAAGTGAVDAFKTATGTSGTAGYVSSGSTAALTGDNELALGFYADSGFGRTLAADSSFTERVNVSPTSDMEFLVEDALPLRGDTPAARVSTGGNTPWTMATVVLKSGTPSPPALSVTPGSLSFSATQGGANPAAKTLSVSNAGGGTLNWTASESASWLSISPSSGTNAGTITVTPSTSGLAPGTYTTDVTVTAAGAGGSPKTIPVTLTVDAATPPSLSVTPASLSFSATQGGASPAAKTLSVSNAGGGTMSWTVSDDASWLAVSPSSGTDGGTVTVTPSTAGLSAGTYTATVTVTAAGAGGSPKTIPVTLTVDPPQPPGLAVSPTSLAFTATQGGANPAAKTVSVTNTGSGALDVTASDDAAWLTVSPASASAPATLAVTPSISGLAAGTYTATVTVTATTSGATGSPKTIAVTLTVSPASSNLVGAWGFDETSGTTAADASGRGNTGTLNGPARSASGKFGGALSFDGVNDWVTVADANVLDLTTGMTMEAWVRPSAIGSLWRTVMLKEQPGSLIYALYAGDGSGRAATDIFTNADLGLSGTSATPLDTWTHLAATYDGANLRLYVNGVQAASRAITGSIRASTGALRIGGNGTWNDEWFSGLIDEVRLYNRALSAAEIQADMTKAVAGG
jgi:Concanavalin A-like lectin/glucanases superfamily/Fibronectin type III domain/Viral BACON domain